MTVKKKHEKENKMSTRMPEGVPVMTLTFLASLAKKHALT